MPEYKTLADLPEGVRNNVPKHGQEIYMKAFNSAWKQYDTPEERRGDNTREETSHKVAWAAVKQDYQKDDKTGHWHSKNE